MAKRKKSAISRTAVKTFIVGLVAIAAGLFVCQRIFHLFTNSDYFRIKAVVIDSSLSFINKHELSNLKDKNIFMVNVKQIQRHLTFKYPQVSDLRVLRMFPNQIHIQAKARHPCAQVQAGNKVLTLDEKGIVLSSSTSKDKELPLIDTFGQRYPRFTLGMPLNGGDHKIGLEIIQSFKLNRALSSYKIDNINIQSLSKIDVYLTNRLHVIFDAAKIEQKIKILGLILAQGKVDLNEVKYIDLRFKEPILGKK